MTRKNNSCFYKGLIAQPKHALQRPEDGSELNLQSQKRHIGTDFIAAAVIAHFKRKNASVLDQVCVTGFDNNYFNPEIHHFEGLSARWPTTQPDFRRMGMEAARLLIDQIETGEADARVEKILSCPFLIPGSGTGG